MLPEADSAGPIKEQLTALGNGYARRTDELACVAGSMLEDAGSPGRPAEGASPAEWLEYVLAGGDTSYPVEGEPDHVGTGGQP